MPIIIEESDYHVDYHVDSPLELRRWMCSNCGLIFDFCDDDYGYPRADASQNPWTGEWEVSEYCLRCGVSLDKQPLVPIEVREAGIEGPVKAIFFVEDKMHKLVVDEIARELGREVEVQVVGNRSGVVQWFKFSQNQGGWANGYFVIDLDNKCNNHSDEKNFIQLNKYCMENYFFDLDVCAAVLGKTAEQVRVSILEIIIKYRGAITKGSRYCEFFIDKLKLDGNLDTFLAYVEAKKVLEGFLKDSGMNERDFVREYIKRSHSMSVMRQVLPDKLVELIQDVPIQT
jgi:rubredoxin